MLGTLATIYRQRGLLDDCEQMLDMESEVTTRFERFMCFAEPEYADWKYKYNNIRCERRRFNECVALFRENAAYEAKQGFTFDESDYLSMIPLILKKEPTARVFERLTDAEILRIVEALVGFADSAGYGESRTQLRTCSSCRAQEPHRRLLDVRAMPPTRSIATGLARSGTGRPTRRFARASSLRQPKTWI